MHHGLKANFKENEAFYCWMKHIMGLPLLPEEDIEAAWKELKKRPLPGVPSLPLQKLKKYVQTTWINQRLDKLSVYGQPHRTNNSVESLNKRWNAKVITKHPNFWHICEFIWEDFQVNFLKFTCVSNTVGNMLICTSKNI